MAEWAGFTCEAIWALRDAEGLSELEWKVGIGLVSLAEVDREKPKTATVTNKSLARIAAASRCNRQRALDGIRRLAAETGCRLRVRVVAQASALGDKAPHEYRLTVCARGGVAVEDHGVAPVVSHQQHLGPVEQQGVAVEDQGCCCRGPSYEDPSMRISCEEDLAPAPAAPPASAATAPPLELETQNASAPAPKAKRARAPKAKPTHPATDALKVHYVTELKRLRQAEAVFDNWGRAQRGFSDLAQLVGEERARAVITSALGNAYCSRIQPWELKADVNKHTGQAPPRNGHRQGPVQPNYGVLREEDYQ